MIILMWFHLGNMSWSPDFHTTQETPLTQVIGVVGVKGIYK